MVVGWVDFVYPVLYASVKLFAPFISVFLTKELFCLSLGFHYFAFSPRSWIQWSLHNLTSSFFGGSAIVGSVESCI
nr:hypothetical protein CFP56_58976 [Quercus suber]